MTGSLIDQGWGPLLHVFTYHLAMGKDIEFPRGKNLAQPDHGGPDKGKRLAYNREGVGNQTRSQARCERDLLKILRLQGEDVPRRLRILLGGRKRSH